MKHRLLRAFEPSELRWDLWPEPPVVLRGIVCCVNGEGYGLDETESVLECFACFLVVR